MTDVIVIGGGVSGLVAATYLARAGRQVTLLEAQERLGGFSALISFGQGFSTSPGAQTLYALDPRVTADLKLARHGLTFVVRDMPFVKLDGNGKHIVLQRDIHATAANIAVHSTQDARVWPQFRRELFDLARALRPLWLGEGRLPQDDMQRRVARLSKTGAAAWLDSWFESDALKAALCFDATSGGLSPIEPGSALTLVWRAAQEISGLQGAVAMAAGETLVASLIAVAQAAGVNIQTGARVSAILNDGESVSGVRCENGEVHPASQVLSSLPRSEVFRNMMPPLADGLAQAGRYACEARPVGRALLLLALNGQPRFGGFSIPLDGRFVLSESPNTLTNADLMARAGLLADDLSMEVAIPSASDHSLAPSGQHVVSMLLHPVPYHPVGGWQNFKPKLVERAVQTFEGFAPGTAAKIAAAKLFAPDKQYDTAYHAPAGVEHLLAGYETRISSSLRGLLFCGPDSEPVPAVSGRAARLAATTLTRRK